MDKAGKEGKLWISGLYDYSYTTIRWHCITIATPDTVHTKGERASSASKHFRCPRYVPNLTGTHEGNKPEKKYIELTPGTPVWVQHRQNATWEPPIVVNQCAPNSYWIMQEKGTEQPKVYKCTRTMLKIRSTTTDVEQTGHIKDYLTEIRKSESRILAIPNMARDSVHENSLENISPDPVQSTLPRLDLP